MEGKKSKGTAKEVKKLLDATDEELTIEDIEEEQIEEMEEKEKEKPKPSPPPAKKKENRNIPCMLRFKKVTATQAANVVKLFKKSKYTDYTISHAKGHNMWDILVRFKNLDERDKFEKWINSLL